MSSVLWGLHESFAHLSFLFLFVFCFLLVSSPLFFLLHLPHLLTLHEGLLCILPYLYPFLLIIFILSHLFFIFSLPSSCVSLMSRQFTTLHKLCHQINQYCLDPRGVNIAADTLAKPDMSNVLLVVHYITAKWPDLPLSAWNNPFPLDWLLSRNTFQQAVLSLLHLADFTCI